MNPTRRLLLSCLGALSLASAILVTTVLPAEYGWDPLGTGAAMGLLGLAEDTSTPLHAQEQGWRQDRVEFQLAPFESVEYKYRMEQGSALLYEWRADGEVVFDLHSEPDGAAPGYAESFAKSRGTADQGNYTAPFGGLHGWFWQNRGSKPITVHLRSAGFYDHALEMREGGAWRRELPQP
jgi:hypothetical protein